MQDKEVVFAVVEKADPPARPYKETLVLCFSCAVERSDHGEQIYTVYSTKGEWPSACDQCGKRIIL